MHAKIKSKTQGVLLNIIVFEGCYKPKYSTYQKIDFMVMLVSTTINVAANAEGKLNVKKM